ncbi:MAG: hypothetical protein Q9171_003880 [Xanthocarpia ochracea]
MDQTSPETAQFSGKSNTELLRELSTTVNSHAAAATFACGGSVDLTTAGVTIRWDANDYRDPHKTSFPASQGAGRSFESLLKHCEPATFGLGNHDILDEGYRKAGKLDHTAFSTNFHPHDYGIVDALQRILMPFSARGANDNYTGSYGVRAELYKLNVYSAPLGKFLSHVDTPRGLSQFGSLVVCLPWAHEGGTLRVKHFGQTIDFTWASPDPKSIQWAAFYGDCEHEVLEVTSGHRVTLTYNLYYTMVDNLALPISDPTKLPLYNTVAQMLREPNFMRKGGCVGFFCHHAYAHATEAGRKQIPGAFKGIDLAVFSAFSSLGLEVDIHPILDRGGRSSDRRFGGLLAKQLLDDSVLKGDDERDFVERFQASVYRRRKAIGKKVWGYQEFCDDKDYKKAKWIKQHTTIAGSEIHGPMFNNEENALENHGALPEWQHNKILSVIWMNEPQHQDFACAGMAWGNEAELAYKFSAAAILVTIPPSSARDADAGIAARPSNAESEPELEPPRPADELMEKSKRWLGDAMSDSRISTDTKRSRTIHKRKLSPKANGASKRYENCLARARRSKRSWGFISPPKTISAPAFATELVLRRDSVATARVAIIPSIQRSDQEKENLLAFKAPSVRIDNISSLIEAAKGAMGLGSGTKAFSDDVLRVEISGPEQSHLTLVDLPGLTHAEGRQQSAEGVQLVSSLVRSYMANTRSIILAVVSAENNPANQIVTKLARDVDPTGVRILGIITKSDTLRVASDSEKAFLDVIVSELANLICDIQAGINECRSTLIRLGEARGSLQEQRLYLFLAAVDGATPFVDAMTLPDFKKRLRAVVQGTLVEFEKDIRREGYSQEITEDISLRKKIDTPRHILRSDFLNIVGELVRRSRGCEMPGIFNPLIIGDFQIIEINPIAVDPTANRARLMRAPQRWALIFDNFV